MERLENPRLLNTHYCLLVRTKGQGTDRLQVPGLGIRSGILTSPVKGLPVPAEPVSKPCAGTPQKHIFKSSLCLSSEAAGPQPVPHESP